MKKFLVVIILVLSNLVFSRSKDEILVKEIKFVSVQETNTVPVLDGKL